MEYLGFGVTRDGVKPINNQIEAIDNMKPPTYYLRSYSSIGVIIY